jgi:hypothetical protein
METRNFGILLCTYLLDGDCFHNDYVTKDTTEMMGQLLRSVFTTVWGEEKNPPGTYREQGC